MRERNATVQRRCIHFDCGLAKIWWHFAFFSCRVTSCNHAPSTRLRNSLQSTLSKSQLREHSLLVRLQLSIISWRGVKSQRAVTSRNTKSFTTTTKDKKGNAALRCCETVRVHRGAPTCVIRRYSLPCSLVSLWNIFTRLSIMWYRTPSWLTKSGSCWTQRRWAED